MFQRVPWFGRRRFDPIPQQPSLPASHRRMFALAQCSSVITIVKPSFMLRGHDPGTCLLAVPGAECALLAREGPLLRADRSLHLTLHLLI
jgi:hypothetical protein